ncbi:ubiquitin-activating enzyme E1 [Klosneuvirus KNV1]|uniref:E1 ubiquitin-activating enzyme n=1 Tax=Klosneuvirus KNV1 TaxID=1977640 RepID=A0A1V0SIK8_9VIRU|nr:ubiquitin-activating enzyme E1 [Klosneuvirus KNV1]
MDPHIDEGLYSRQLYAVGFDAMKRMANSSILICGMNGLGVEIAKNVILQGFKKVSLYDSEKVTNLDLSTNYYASHEDIGKNRAQVCQSKLAELNNYVSVDIINSLTTSTITDYQVIVLVDFDLNEQLKINEMIHDRVHFITVSTKGLVGQIFCDFGNEFTITDPDGEQPSTSIIEHIILNNDELLVTTVESNPHSLTNGDYVKFNDVKGMNELNNLGPQPITYVDKYNFKIKISGLKLNKYEGGGQVTCVKMPKKVNFKLLKDSIESPEFIITDFSDFDKPAKFHAMFRSLDSLGQHHSLDDFTKKVKSYRDVEDKLIEKFYHTCQGKIVPMNSVIGGITAQEVAKACSGKFTPIYQYLYYDALDCVSENYKDIKTHVIGTRYDAQIKVFGEELQHKLKHMKYFIVGSGAIGCELLKNFAMMGIGHLVVTDMDTIERSNLNRQFLFRNKDIGSSKSKAASHAISQMNPNIKVEPHFNRVGLESENVYDMKFFESLDGVANALDNIDARKYMDGRCVLFKKSLLESGTLGTKGNVQVIVPHLTESYSSSSDPAETSIPICTIKTFPNEISHCIAWSRELFEDLFVQKPKNLIEYINNTKKVSDMPPSDVLTFSENIKFIYKYIPESFDDCIKFAYEMWHQYYVKEIAQLLYKFPSDATTTSGTPFWSGAKKCPHTINFDVNDDLHVNYVIAMANIWANIFHIKNNTDNIAIGQNQRFSYDHNTIKNVIKQLTPPKVTIDENVKISANDEEEKKRQAEESAKPIDISELIKSLPPTTIIKKLHINPQEFEKDDDRNHHIDFMAHASNMRASNYDIKIANRHTIKGIAGKIIPALATTTAVVAGLVSLELYKLAQGFNKIENYRNSFLNLALPYIGFSEPIKVTSHKVGSKEYTMWDTFIIQGEMTLKQLIESFNKLYDIDIDTITYGNFMLFSPFINQKKIQVRMNMNIKDIIETELTIKLKNSSINLQICANIDDEEDDTELPEVLYML